MEESLAFKARRFENSFVFTLKIKTSMEKMMNRNKNFSNKDELSVYYNEDKLLTYHWVSCVTPFDLF